MFVYDTQDFKNFRNNLFLNDSTSFSLTKNKLLFPIENINSSNSLNSSNSTNSLNKNIDLVGVYKSASITFYSKTYGYLLCKEVRDNKLVYHPIGGKYEERDQSIEYTAAREFIEETGILKNRDFIHLLEQNNELNNNDLEKCGINFIYNIILNNNITHYYDFYVNVNKEYIHKYYLINMDKLSENLMKIIKNMDIFYHDTFKESTNNDEYIIGLNWNKEIIKNNLNKKNYSMLTIYLSNLIKSNKL